MSEIDGRITSNVKGKLKKMIDGVIFSDPLIFITEFFQNAYRAKAKEVTISLDIDQGKLTFWDNGKGLRNPKDLLTLDYSNWESTDEGFGIGFWSWLGIKHPFETQSYDVCCEIYSKYYYLVMSKDQLLLNDDPTAVTRKVDVFTPGFKVILTSDLFKNRELVDQLRERIVKDGEMMPFPVFLNQSRILPKNLMDDVSGDYVRDFHLRYFDARLSLCNYYGHVTLYYEKRKVMQYTAEAQGVIELKKGALNLREPDRTDYAMDAKADRFSKAFKQCSKELYLSFLAFATPKEINNYASMINSVLEPKEYARFLNIDEVPPSKISLTSASEDIKEGTYIPTKNKNVAAASLAHWESQAVATPIIDYHPDDLSTGTNLLEALKDTRKKVWVDASEIQEFSDLIGKAEYYGIHVLVAKNILYKSVFESKQVPHLSEIKNDIVKTHITKNVGIRTGKEKRFIELLNPIVKHFDLSENVFSLANLEILIEVKLKNSVVYREHLKNTKHQFVVFGVTDHDSILLDRRALRLNTIHFSPTQGMGKNELHVLLTSVDTIAHELAHYLFNTEDNTLKHYKQQEKIRREIVDLYTNL